MTRNKFLLLVVLTVLAFPLYAIKDSKHLPKLPKTENSSQFMEALTSAYTNTPELQEKFTQQKINAEGVSKAKSGWRPTINAEGSVSRNRTDTESPSPSGTNLRNTTNGSLTASQNVFNSGGTVAAVSAAENSVKAGWADFLNTEQSVLLAAATAYLDLFSAREVYKLNEKNEDVLKKLLESVETRAQLGELTGTDVANAQSKLADAVTKRIAALADLESKKGTYLKAIGKEAPDSQELPSLPEEIIPTDFSELVNQSMIHNPAIINADYNSKANYDNIGVAQAAILPKVNVSGSAQRTITGSSSIVGRNSRSNEYQAKATLSIPIYQGGAEWSDLRKARETSTQTKITLEKTRQAVREAVTKQWETWVSARLRIEQIKTQIKSAEVALEGVKSEFREGERIFIEVLDAEKNLFETKVSLEQAKKDLYVSTYTLLSLVGRFTASHLKLPVEKYDVEGHYTLVKGMLFGTAEG